MLVVWYQSGQNWDFSFVLLFILPIPNIIPSKSFLSHLALYIYYFNFIFLSLFRAKTENWNVGRRQRRILHKMTLGRTCCQNAHNTWANAALVWDTRNGRRNRTTDIQMGTGILRCGH